MDINSIDRIILSYIKGTSTIEEDKILSEFISENPENLRYFAEIKAIAHYISENSNSGSDSAYERNTVCRTIKKKHMARAICAAASVLLVCLASFFIIEKRNTVSISNQSNKIELVSLPDNTKVWLSENSSLSYNKRKFEDERHLKLDGEAEFDVTKKNGATFKVITNSIEVIVSGTVFNVRDYSYEELAEVTLAEGAVSMKRKGSDDLFRINVGQKVSYNASSNEIKTENVSVNALLNRTNGIISIENATIHQIIERIEHEFGTSLAVVSVGEINEKKFTLNYTENASLEDVIGMLETISGYRVEQKTRNNHNIN